MTNPKTPAKKHYWLSISDKEECDRLLAARDAEWERMIDDNVWFWNKDGNPRTASQIYKDIQKQITILKARTKQ